MSGAGDSYQEDVALDDYSLGKVIASETRSHWEELRVPLLRTEINLLPP